MNKKNRNRKNEHETSYWNFWSQYYDNETIAHGTALLLTLVAASAS